MRAFLCPFRKNQHSPSASRFTARRYIKPGHLLHFAAKFKGGIIMATIVFIEIDSFGRSNEIGRVPFD